MIPGPLFMANVKVCFCVEVFNNLRVFILGIQKPGVGRLLLVAQAPLFIANVKVCFCVEVLNNLRVFILLGIQKPGVGRLLLVAQAQYHG
jgi:hypothetical protein